ncbi:phosphomannomutase/phosphoglucomutase [Candidatus Uhrbacteria bacterium]|nr:phosphomannomutase/phosphoglucomutase [Candidatus Uhrbacteria bacterium]
MSIFKAYDIRGTVPNEINETVAERFGKAYAEFLIAKNSDAKKPLSIAVGMDNRISSPALHAQVIRAMRESDINVVDIGLCSTPFYYFAVSYLGLDGGIMVTASHNPPQYNGFKPVLARAAPLGSESGLKDIEAMYEKIPVIPDLIRNPVLGTLSSRDILGEYIDANLAFAPPADMQDLTVTVDVGNGVSSLMCAALFDRLSCKLIPLYFELDGTFPNHMPNPLIEENIKTLKKTVREKHASLGIAFDADGDRSIFVDERGETIPADLMTALVGRELLALYPHEHILYDLRSSWAVKEAIAAAGGTPSICRVGHAFIKKQMMDEHALFAGEVSGHFYLRFANFGYFEAPLVVTLLVLNLMARTGKPLSELVQPLRTYFSTGEINFEVADKAVILKTIETRYADAKSIAHLDGVSIEYDDWWCNVRASNTENLLRLNLEAKTENLRDEKLAEVQNIIQK